jgi:hypothetical protein
MLLREIRAPARSAVMCHLPRDRVLDAAVCKQSELSQTGVMTVTAAENVLTYA